MYELDTYPFFEKWLVDHIHRNHTVFGEVKTATNVEFIFGCRYEFDIIAGFQTGSKKILRLYNIEVKIDSNINGLIQQGFRNNISWFDYVIIAIPLNHNLSYFINRLFDHLQTKPERININFGCIVFDWEYKRTFPILTAKLNKNLLGKKERNQIITKLGFEGENLLFTGY